MAEEKTSEKKKAKFNVVDAMIILAVVLCVAGIIFRAWYYDSDTGEKSENTVRVTLKIRNVENQVISLPAENDFIYFENQTVMGKIAEISYSASKNEFEASNGQKVISEIEELSDVLIVAEFKCESTPNGFRTADMVYLRAGQTYGFTSSHFAGECLITDVSLKTA